MRSQQCFAIKKVPLSKRELMNQNELYKGTGGVSCENRSDGFAPAFLDTHTGNIYLSRFSNGFPAPIHILEGLPETMVTKRAASGCVLQVDGSVIAGFVREGEFYTREQAAEILAHA